MRMHRHRELPADEIIEPLHRSVSDFASLNPQTYDTYDITAIVVKVQDAPL